MKVVNFDLFSQIYSECIVNLFRSSIYHIFFVKEIADTKYKNLPVTHKFVEIIFKIIPSLGSFCCIEVDVGF